MSFSAPTLSITRASTSPQLEPSVPPTTPAPPRPRRTRSARRRRAAEALGRLGLGGLQVLGPDAEHDLADVLPEVFAPPLLDLSHYLAAQGYSGAAKGDRVAAVLPLQACPEEVHRRGSYKARHENVVRMVVHLLRRVHLLHEAVF